MIVTFYHRAYSPVQQRHYYIVLCENGVSFETQESDYIKTGTKLVLSDDMCMPDSGWIEWQCEKDGLVYWTRTRPGGKVLCPMCQNEEQCPEDVKLMDGENSGCYIDEDEI